MKKYDSYKDSGIEWIGVIPEHWAESKIKYLSKEPSSLFIDGDWIESKVIVEEGIRYITTGNIKVGYYSEQGSGFISEETFAELNCTEVYEGDLVISRLNSPIGRACIIPNLNNRIVTSVDNVIFRPDSNVNKFYLLYLFCSKEYFEITDLISRGATMQRISRGLYGNIKIPLPSIKEQNAIASYLAQKTTQIDHLIAKKEQFIQLLEEERVAVINQAVTKGLDPSVPMKDSGIEWLGDIPESWEVKKLKHITSKITDGSHFSPPTESEGRFYISVTDITKSNSINFENSKRISDNSFDELARNGCKPIKGDILITKDGTIGRGVIVEDFDDFVILSSLGLIRLNNKQNPYYILFYLLSGLNIDQMYSNIRGSGITRLTIKLINDLIVVVPSIEEQIKIENYLKLKTNEIDKIIIKSKQEIELLNEYKTALISEVVTGKVDVRNEKLN